MVWEIINNYIVPILQWISYITAVVSLSILIITFVAPPKVSTPIKKSIKKFTLRNEDFYLKVEKAFEVKDKSLEPVKLRETLKENLKIIFSKFDIQVFDKQHDHGLSARMVRNGFDININILIIPEGDHYSENYEIFVSQSTKTKFKSIEKCLNATLWNLIKFKDENNNLITPVSKNVEVSIDAEGLKVFMDLFEAAGTNIIGNNISMRQQDGHTFIRIRDEFEIEFAKKVKNLIALGHI